MYRIERMEMPSGSPATVIVREEEVEGQRIRMTYDASLLAITPPEIWAETLEAEWAFRTEKN